MSPLEYQLAKERCERGKRSGIAKVEQVSPMEKETKAEIGREIESLHRPYIAWLTRTELPYSYSRSDRKSTLPLGHADFAVQGGRDGRGVYIEFKTDDPPEKGLREEQCKWIAMARAAGAIVLVTNSYEEARDFTIRVLGLG